MKIILHLFARFMYIILLGIFIALPVGFVLLYKTFLYSNDSLSTIFFILGLVGFVIIGFSIVLSMAIGISKIEER